MTVPSDVVLQTVREMAGDPDATEFSHLSRDLALDSLDKIEIAMDLENKLMIEITDDQIEACQTVADIVALAHRLVSARVVQ